jgi:hypothetical protein
MSGQDLAGFNGAVRAVRAVGAEEKKRQQSQLSSGVQLPFMAGR